MADDVWLSVEVQRDIKLAELATDSPHGRLNGEQRITLVPPLSAHTTTTLANKEALHDKTLARNQNREDEVGARLEPHGESTHLSVYTNTMTQ